MHRQTLSSPDVLARVAKPRFSCRGCTRSNQALCNGLNFLRQRLEQFEVSGTQRRNMRAMRLRRMQALQSQTSKLFSHLLDGSEEEPAHHPQCDSYNQDDKRNDAPEAPLPNCESFTADVSGIRHYRDNAFQSVSIVQGECCIKPLPLARTSKLTDVGIVFHGLLNKSIRQILKHSLGPR